MIFSLLSSPFRLCECACFEFRKKEEENERIRTARHDGSPYLTSRQALCWKDRRLGRREDDRKSKPVSLPAFPSSHAFLPFLSLPMIQMEKLLFPLYRKKGSDSKREEREAKMIPLQRLFCFCRLRLFSFLLAQSDSDFSNVSYILHRQREMSSESENKKGASISTQVIRHVTALYSLEYRQSARKEEKKQKESHERCMMPALSLSSLACLTLLCISLCNCLVREKVREQVFKKHEGSFVMNDTCQGSMCVCVMSPKKKETETYPQMQRKGEHILF